MAGRRDVLLMLKAAPLLRPVEEPPAMKEGRPKGELAP